MLNYFKSWVDSNIIFIIINIIFQKEIGACSVPESQISLISRGPKSLSTLLPSTQVYSNLILSVAYNNFSASKTFLSVLHH